MRFRPTASLVFLVSAVLLTVGIVVDHGLVAESSDRNYRTGFGATEEQAMGWASPVVLHGDRLFVRPELLNVPAASFSSYRVFVTDAAGFRALSAGGQPAQVYAKVTGLRPGHCCDAPGILIERQDGPSGLDRDAERWSVSGSASKLYVVWVFSYASGQAPAAADLPRFEEEKGHLFDESLLTRSGAPFVLPGWAVQVRSAAYVVQVASALAVTGATGAYAWRLRRVRQDADPSATGTEALLDLHRTAGTYLQSLRDVLVGGILAAVLILLSILTLTEGGELHMVDAVTLTPFGRDVLLASFLLVDLGVAVAWALTIVTIHRALRRWRARAALPPIDV